MKKLVLVLILCLSSFSFANWKIIDTFDEFQEPSGEKCIFSIDSSNFGLCRIQKNPKVDGQYVVILAPNEYIGGDFTVVKVKIDDLEPFSFKGAVVREFVGFVFNENDTNLLKLLSKGKTLKITIRKFDDTTILQKHDLNGFTKVFEEYSRN